MQEQRIAELTAAAEEIVEAVNKLNRETGGQLVSLSVRAKRNRTMIWGLAASLFLDLLLTIFMVVVAQQVSDTQQMTRNQVLCPLYQQFVNADTPASRELARKNGQDMEARKQAFAVIHKSYDALECAKLKK
jgi:hypothetical protein